MKPELPAPRRCLQPVGIETGQSHLHTGPKATLYPKEPPAKVTGRQTG